MTIDTIGIAGTGEMAAAIAGRIAAVSGARMIVHGFSPAKPTGRKVRVEQAANLFDLASECHAVIAIYDTHAALREALTGTAERPGLLGAMAPGTLVVDMSGGLPGECLRLAGQLSGGAIGLVEIGMCGGIGAMSTGAARLFAGGYGEHIELVTPVLSCLGTLKRAGPQGSGRMLAALLETVRAAHYAAMAEAQGIAAASGIVPDEIAEPPLSDEERSELARHAAIARAIAAAHDVETPLLDTVAGGLKPNAR